MSRIGKMPIAIPKGVKIEWREPVIKVTGGKDTLERTIHPSIKLEVTADQITVNPVDQSAESRSLWGLTRTLINNMVIGVSTGFQKVLEVQGVGWKAEAAGDLLKLSLGFSHPVDYKMPKGVTAQVDGKTNKITIAAADKELLGQICANIRKLRKPEPYKGKGVRYEGEYVQRKVGKAGGK